ncbi:MULTISPECIES: hypothetical protein [unclassified Microcoleus]|uniref:hypothetical protein n=1 Tax=unclassified Microcoleus TaxID=2642155 RepID=UPI002FD014E4
MGIGNWELGIGNWELGIGNWCVTVESHKPQVKAFSLSHTLQARFRTPTVIRVRNLG